MPKPRDLFPFLLNLLQPPDRPGRPRRRRWRSSQRKNSRRRLRALQRNRSPLAVDEAEMARHIEQWSALQRGVMSSSYRFYSLASGRQTRDYIPDDIYYYIVEPILNERGMASFVANKTLSPRIWGTDPFPRALVRHMRGHDYDAHYERIDAARWDALLASEDHVVVKPARHSGGGRGIRFFSRVDGRLQDRAGAPLQREQLTASYRGDYLIEARVQQHPYFAHLNESSLNTFRVMTYRSVADDQIVILGHVIRIGQPGSQVDNQSAGGVTVDVCPDGHVDALAYDVAGNRSDRAPSGLPLTDLPPVPEIDALRTTAIDVAGKLVHHRLLGIDLCLDHEGRVRLLEVNLGNLGISFYQLPGNPLFGSYTQEVIEYCRERL